jgi:acetyltransferase-like isoleucine patch superfamily enzyme
LPAQRIPRDEYDRQHPKSAWRRGSQRLKLLLARFMIPSGLRVRLYRAMGAHIAPHVYIGLDTILDDTYPELITMEEDSGVTFRLVIATHDAEVGPDGQLREVVAPVHIGARSWIAAGSVVMPGVRIGADTIVGAGSVVTEDVPSGVIAVGNPCRVIKQRDLSLADGSPDLVPAGTEA